MHRCVFLVSIILCLTFIIPGYIEAESLYGFNENQLVMDKESNTSFSEPTEERNGPTLDVPVLLSKAKWNSAKLAADLKSDWGIENDPNNVSDEAVVIKTDDATLCVAHMGFPVPGGEAEEYARFNYLWTDAEKVARKHKSHLMATVLTDKLTDFEAAKLLTKLVCSCLKQKYVTGVFNDAAVVSPSQYVKFAQPLLDDKFPVGNWVWLGIAEHDGKSGFYTWGLRDFGKEEIEMFGDEDSDINEMYSRLFNIVSYVMNDDVTLKPGETIGYTEDERLPITLSKGWVISGETLKIPPCSPR